MTADRPRNLAASVRQRLMNKAREQKEPFDLVLIRFALERLLYRISISSHSGRFVLKGAMLFQIWSGEVHRPTRDLDLLGTGAPAPADFEQLFREVCVQEVEDDGLVFQPETVSAERMKEDEQYEGIRLKLQALLASARIPIQVDIGFGDAVTPGVDHISYPVILDFPSPMLRTYPRETVVAEKFQAMVMLGIANSRMKDFFDIWSLARTYEFSGATLSAAIKATFERRQTPLPETPPLAFTPEFSQDRHKVTQWNAFLRKSKLVAEELSLVEVVAVLSDFLMPPTHAILSNSAFSGAWSAGGGWYPETTEKR
jgi:predicted nucleotidyltransferase component of viral defense system